MVEFTPIKTKKYLIAKIIPLNKNTHNEQDVKDLQTMSYKELILIYKDLTS